MRHVHHVLRAVPSLASTKVPVTCPALRLASACHATCVALRTFPVGTNALAFVVKHVLKATAIYAAVKTTLELISSK
jgi:hypothetical protein